MSTYSSSTDSAVLFAAIAQNDETAFEALFRKYRNNVYAVAFKWVRSVYLSEEITQDVFISIWVSRARLNLVKDPQAYLYASVFNKVSRCMKKESNKARIMQAYLQQTKEYSNETEEAICANDTNKIINHAIDQLPAHKKRIFKLSRQQGQGYDAIGQLLQLSPHTVKSHLTKAVKSVRHYVKGNSLLLAPLLLLLV